jgi:hypothetical protein
MIAMPALGSRKGYQYTVALRAVKAGWTNGIGKETKQFFPETLADQTIRRTIATMWSGVQTVPYLTVLSSPVDLVATHPSEVRAAQGPAALLADLLGPVVQDLMALHHHLRDLTALEEADPPYTSHPTVS